MATSRPNAGETVFHYTAGRVRIQVQQRTFPAFDQPGSEYRADSCSQGLERGDVRNEGERLSFIERCD